MDSASGLQYNATEERTDVVDRAAARHHAPASRGERRGAFPVSLGGARRVRDRPAGAHRGVSRPARPRVRAVPIHGGDLGADAGQRRYEPQSTLATKLGNTESGDGKRFKGRGPIQITGRANYRRFGSLLGLDLISDPARAALPEVAFRIAGLFWSKKGLNELADQVTPDAFREITRRINGGFNGLAERQRFYDGAKSVLGVTAAAVSRARRRAPSDSVEPVFERGQEAIRAATPARRRPGAARKTAKKVARKAVRKTGSAKRAAAAAARQEIGEKSGDEKARQ